MTLAARRPAQTIVCAMVAGLAAANLFRPGPILILVAAAGAVAASVDQTRALACLVSAAVALAWWWGGARLDALDRSVLASSIGMADRARVVFLAPPRPGRFDVRVEADVVRFGYRPLHERTLVKFAAARPPPQGSIVEGVGNLVEPAPARNGFDERRWLRRRGIHTVLRLRDLRVVGHRGGVGGVADRIHAWLARSVARGLHGQRAAILEGVVLGDDAQIDEGLRRRFRASGLYHLLAVSGQNVALVAAGALGLTWLAGLPRRVGEVAAFAGIVGYVLAVGPQPSVVRAGIAGALTTGAWLSGRLTDRWHFLFVAASVLLAWNPYTLFDAGFQLSFAAVGAIFVLVPRVRRVLDGYPLPSVAADAIAVSAACALATAPVMWLQFHSISLGAVPANALAAPAMVPLLALAFGGALVAPIVPQLATALAWLNGWLAAYIATCARMIGSMPGAQVRSTSALLLLLAGASVAAAYALERWPPSSSPST